MGGSGGVVPGVFGDGCSGREAWCCEAHLFPEEIGVARSGIRASGGENIVVARIRVAGQVKLWNEFCNLMLASAFLFMEV